MHSRKSLSAQQMQIALPRGTDLTRNSKKDANAFRRAIAKSSLGEAVRAYCIKVVQIGQFHTSLSPIPSKRVRGCMLRDKFGYTQGAQFRKPHIRWAEFLRKRSHWSRPRLFRTARRARKNDSVMWHSSLLIQQNSKWCRFSMLRGAILFGIWWQQNYGDLWNMRLYEGTVSNFNRDVLENKIADQLSASYENYLPEARRSRRIKNVGCPVTRDLPPD